MAPQQFPRVILFIAIVLLLAVIPAVHTNANAKLDIASVIGLDAIGLDAETRRVVDELINAIMNGSATWEQALDSAIADLSDVIARTSEDLKEVALGIQHRFETLKSEMQVLMQSFVATLGAESRCDADFVTQRTIEGAKHIADTILAPDTPSPTPIICQVVPDAPLRMEKRGEQWFIAGNTFFNLYGYNFPSSSAEWSLRPTVTLMNNAGVIRPAEVAVLPVTQYRFTLDFQPEGENVQDIAPGVFYALQWPFRFTEPDLGSIGVQLVYEASDLALMPLSIDNPTPISRTNFSVTGKIKNQGESSSADADLWLRRPGYGELHLDVPSLTPGQEWPYKFTLAYPSAARHEFVVVLESAENVDTSNNSLTGVVNVRPRQARVTVTFDDLFVFFDGNTDVWPIVDYGDWELIMNFNGQTTEWRYSEVDQTRYPLNVCKTSIGLGTICIESMARSIGPITLNEGQQIIVSISAVDIDPSGFQAMGAFTHHHQLPDGNASWGSAVENANYKLTYTIKVEWLN